MTEIQRDLTRTVLAVLCILLLIAASFWVLRPFLAATVWATMVVVATWPLLKSLEQRFGGRRVPAVAVMTLAMLLLLVLPLGLAVGTIAEHAESVVDLVKNLAASGLPTPPEWLAGIPLVGAKLTDLWLQLGVAEAKGLARQGRALRGGVRKMAPRRSRWIRHDGSPVPAHRAPVGCAVCQWRGRRVERAPFRTAPGRCARRELDHPRRAGRSAAWRSSLWRLRGAGIDVVESDKASIYLREWTTTDLDELCEWADRLIAGTASEADLHVPEWTSTVAELLPGWYDEWVIFERERIRQRMLHALEVLSQLLRKAGRYGEAIDAAMDAVAIEPLRETAHRALAEGARGRGQLHRGAAGVRPVPGSRPARVGRGAQRGFPGVAALLCLRRARPGEAGRCPLGTGRTWR